MANRTSAPKQITWIICLILYIVALLAHFGVVRLGNGIGDWAWIVVAARVRRTTRTSRRRS